LIHFFLGNFSNAQYFVTFWPFWQKFVSFFTCRAFDLNFELLGSFFGAFSKSFLKALKKLPKSSQKAL
jgi:hypothetical protein